MALFVNSKFSSIEAIISKAIEDSNISEKRLHIY